MLCTAHLLGSHEVTPMKVGVLKETAPGERRVALVPEMLARLRGAGLDVLVQSGAGDGAWFADSAPSKLFRRSSRKYAVAETCC